MPTIEDLQEGEIMDGEPPFPGFPEYNPATFWGELSAFESTKESLRGVPTQSNRRGALRPVSGPCWYCSCAEVWSLILQERLSMEFCGNFIMEKYLALQEERILFLIF